MRVEEIEAPTASEELLLELGALELRATADFAPAPGESRQSPRELVAYYRHVPGGQPRPRWVARDGDELGSRRSLATRLGTSTPRSRSRRSGVVPGSGLCAARAAGSEARSRGIRSL